MRKQDQSKAEAFGLLLRQVREESGLSQCKMAAEAGFDHSYASRLESGKRLPSCAAVLKLADVLTASAYDRARLLLAAGYVPESFANRFMILVDTAEQQASERRPNHARTGDIS